MIFGGLSEKELNEISRVLDNEGIEYEVKTDELIIDSNKESMRYDLRHLSAPSISTHILAIEISELSFEKMSTSLKSKLLEFGITNEIPEEFAAFDKEEITTVHDQQLKGNKRIIGFNLIHQIILIAFVLLVGFFLSRA